MKSLASEAVARSLIVGTTTATRASDHRVFALVLLVAAFVLPAVPSASAAELKWNQERVTVLARELIEPLAALRADLTSRPPVSGKEEARTAVMNDVERLESRARELAQRLASGAGRAETVALFREIETLQSQAMKQAREYPAPFDMHVYIDRAQSITIQLARYYGSRDESNSSAPSTSTQCSACGVRASMAAGLTRAKFPGIVKQERTVVWSGRMGVSEIEGAAQGTLAVAIALADAIAHGAVTVVGGGGSVAPTERSDLAGRVTDVSTGGSASFEFLEGKELPGVRFRSEK